MTRRAVFNDGGAFDDGSPITVFPAAVASVFGRTGAVAAVAGDYFGAMPAALTGATQAARFVGATTSGAPASGTFAVGDVVVARDGHVFVCTTAGTPGTWVDVGAGASISYATPSIVLGSSAAAGAASTVIRSDATIAAFSSNVASTQAFGDAAATGTAAKASREDHKHGMPAALGLTQLIYRYTVAGSDKASIDTGVDTADAGDNVWTGGDVLEVWILHKTDTVAETDTVDVYVNNDTGAGNAHYDRQVLSGANTGVAAAVALAADNWNLGSKGSGDSYAVVSKMAFPAYNNTSFNKTGEGSAMRADDTAGTNAAVTYALAYRSTTALSRMKVIPHTGGAKLKVGSMLLIYKRMSA